MNNPLFLFLVYISKTLDSENNLFNNSSYIGLYVELFYSFFDPS